MKINNWKPMPLPKTVKAATAVQTLTNIKKRVFGWWCVSWLFGLGLYFKG
jgi:hypothetical protein